MTYATTYTMAILRKAAKQIGATVHGPVNGEIFVIAPMGEVWSCDGSIHELVASGWRLEFIEDLESYLIKDLMERMSYGLTRCDDQGCEWCNDA